MNKKKKSKAGHYEIQGETIAKFELFDQGWNPYSRYLDVDKVDLLLRQRNDNGVEYREIQVKYGKLYPCYLKWEKNIFDITSWRFFKEDEFKDYIDSPNLFLIYVLSLDEGYKGDIFIFPISDFNKIINNSLVSSTKKGKQRKLLISRSIENKSKWYVRKDSIKNIKDLSSCIEVTMYRRNFDLLK